MARKLSGLLIVLVCFACVRPRVTPAPSDVSSFQAMTIKFNFSGPQGRQNGKVFLRFDDRRAKFIFFNPLNQVALELDVDGETALLLRPDKKLSWRGDFNRLLDRLWGIELNFQELKQLVLKGTLPEGRTTGKDISIQLESASAERLPRTVRIRRHDAELTLKIISSETRPGRVILLERERRFEPAALEEILGDD